MSRHRSYSEEEQYLNEKRYEQEEYMRELKESLELECEERKIDTEKWKHQEYDEEKNINSLYREKCKTQLERKKASVELSYENGLLDLYKLNLYIAQTGGGIDVINLAGIGVGLDELENKVNEQEDKRNKCYAIWAEFDECFSRQIASYYKAFDLRKNQRIDEYDREYNCRYCGKDERECEEDHPEEFREHCRRERDGCPCGCD